MFQSIQVSPHKYGFFMGWRIHQVLLYWDEAMLHRLLHKVLQLYLISWGGNFVERHSFHIVLVDSLKTLRKLCLSTKCPQQEIRWNYGILRSGLITCSSTWPFPHPLKIYFKTLKNSNFKKYTIEQLRC